MGVAATWLIPSLRHLSGPPPVNSPPVVVHDSAGSFTSPGSTTAPDPAALDAEWAAYSDRSGCADWAGGNGVSAIRLNSSQLAWFFSDTFIGPAGPTTGFSHISGFAHNAVVVQTRTRHGSAFVTVTGGGACTGPGRPGNAAPVVGDSPWLSGTHDRYWDEDGLRTGGTIVKFYNRYAASTFPFVPLGTVIASFDAGQLSSAGHRSRYGATNRPTLVRLPSYTPPAGGSPILWGAAVLRLGDTVYVYGTQSPHVSDPLRHLYLARVPVTQLTAFSSWRFYAGPGTWAPGQQGARPVPLGSGSISGGSTSADVSSGFSVIGAGGRYWLIQAGVGGHAGHRRLPGRRAVGPVRLHRGTAAVPGPVHRAGRRARLPDHVRGAGRAGPLLRQHAGDQLQRQLRGGQHRLPADGLLHQHGDAATVRHGAAGRVRSRARRSARCGAGRRTIRGSRGGTRRSGSPRGACGTAARTYPP